MRLMKKSRFLQRCVSAALILFTAVPFSACGKREKSRFSDTYFGLFDTVITVTAYDDSAAAFASHSKALREELERYNRLFDGYHAYDGLENVCTLNEKAKSGPVRVDQRLFSMLAFGKEAYALSAGKVNICFGSVLALWHEARETGLEDPENAALPDVSALQRAAAHTSIEALVLDEAAQTVYYSDPELRLDVGAVAKGFAGRAAGEYAKQNLWDAVVLSLGGNVIAFGANPANGGGLWNVGVENPDLSASDFLVTVSVTDCAVVTSGDYQRFYTVNGKRYCHIVDPETLFPPERFSGVTVIAPDSALADALSTALFLLPEAEGKRLVETMPGVEAIWAFPDGRTTESAGFQTYLKRN